jgi:hypothetical protein
MPTQAGMTQRATHIRSHVVFEAPAIAFHATEQPTTGRWLHCRLA